MGNNQKKELKKKNRQFERIKKMDNRDMEFNRSANNK